jgi:photosystem II stability/assembly factor-like uncharacterized protein
MDRLEQDLRTTLRDPHRELPTDLVSLDSVYSGSVRRHRRRVAAVSASAAVAVLLVAVPVALNSGSTRGLEPTDPSTTNGPVTASPSPTPTPSRSTASSPQLVNAAALSWGEAQPVSVTALSTSTFYVLGQKKSCLSNCIRLVRSRDGGKTFTALAAPRNTKDMPSSLRFGSSQDGWMGGATLWSTHDGAKAWSRVPMPGQILRLEAAAGTVWALVVTTGSRHDVALYRSPVGADKWSKVALPRLLQGPVDLALQGRRVLVLGTAPEALLVSEDGSHFVARTSPCRSGLGGRLSATATAVWFVCANGTSGSVFVSARGTGPFQAVPTRFLPDAMPNQTLVGARNARSAVLGLPGDGGLVGISSTGSRLSSYPVGTGWTYVGFTSPDVGYALTCCSVPLLLRTTDGGAHWAAVTFDR